MSPLFRLLAALHARGFHAAVIAGLVMMPAVVAAGFLTGGGRMTAPDLGPLRGTIAEQAPVDAPLLILPAAGGPASLGAAPPLGFHAGGRLGAER